MLHPNFLFDTYFKHKYKVFAPKYVYKEFLFLKRKNFFKRLQEV